MRNKFPQYYRIHQEDLIHHFEDCVFIFDASALLDIFRLKKDLTNKIFDVIDHYSDKIIVPYHAAEEYNKDIHEVLKTQLTNIKSSRKRFEDFLLSFQAKRSYPYISQQASELIEQLKTQIEADFREQEEYIETQLIKGTLQNKMADLLTGKILEPFSEEEIKEIEKEGEFRYSNKIPPGWKDASKDNKNRYGDLINWKEILCYAKNNKNKCIIFVANDEKPDWILKEGGKTIGPLYDLLQEFYNTVENNKQLFHIYTLDRFLTFINKKDHSVVSREVIQEVRDNLEKIDFSSPIENYNPSLEYSDQMSPDKLNTLKADKTNSTNREDFNNHIHDKVHTITQNEYKESDKLDTKKMTSDIIQNQEKESYETSVHEYMSQKGICKKSTNN